MFGDSIFEKHLREGLSAVFLHSPDLAGALLGEAPENRLRASPAVPQYNSLNKIVLG